MFKRTRLIIGLVAVLGSIAFITAGVWLLFGDAIQERLRRERFDSVDWQGARNSTSDVRIRMVDDLLRRHDFHAVTRDRLIAIVGEPDEIEYFREWDLVYWLGPERGFMGIDSEWLVFRLDDRERVTDYRIVTD